MIHLVDDHDDMGQIAGQVHRLGGELLAAVIVGVDPALVVLADANRVGAEKSARPFDIGCIRFGGRFYFARRAFAEHGVGIEEAFFAILRHFQQIRGEVGNIPGGVAQGVIAVLKALDFAELRQVGEVGFEKFARPLRADFVIPDGAVEHVVLLIEASEVLRHLEAGFGVQGFP